MKKKIIMLFLLICCITTGCSVKYNINISNNKLSENVVLTSNKNESYNNSDNCTYYNNINEKPVIAINKNNITISILDKENKVDGVGYYNTYYKNGNECTLTFKYTYDLSDYKYAKKPNENVSVFQINYDDEENYFINVSGINIFKNYTGLDDLEVNITTDKIVTDNNADKINNNTYTWFFDENNYQEKSLKIEIGERNIENKEEVVYPDGKTIEELHIDDSTEEPIEEKDNNYTIIIISSILILLVFGLIYYLKKEKNKNKF